MQYFLTTSVEGRSFEETEQRVVELLQQEGFGIVSQINMQETFKNKLKIDFKPYKILGACNPAFAHKALTEQAPTGVFLPCNVCLQQNENGMVDVFVINPLEAMKSIDNPVITSMAEEILQRMSKVIQQL
jgi:uncharacterized protein (DUF302 family)